MISTNDCPTNGKNADYFRLAEEIRPGGHGPLLRTVFCFFALFLYATTLHAQQKDTLRIFHCQDFEVDGRGSAPAWNQADWIPLQQLDSGLAGYDTRFKVLYSGEGIYVLFHGLDTRITSNYQQDFEDLFNADVFECFLHPDPSLPLYFEYEINAYGKELPLLIPHLKTGTMGWLPWHYDKQRKTRKKVFVEYAREKGKKKMKSWSAEIFIPFALLSPLISHPPAAGDCWHANFYRLDYDAGPMVKWAWRPVEKSFHEYNRYGTIQFQ